MQAAHEAHLTSGSTVGLAAKDLSNICKQHTAYSVRASFGGRIFGLVWRDLSTEGTDASSTRHDPEAALENLIGNLHTAGANASSTRQALSKAAF